MTDIDRWSEKHVGSLALTRTIVGFLNVLLSVVVVLKLFELICWILKEILLRLVRDCALLEPVPSMSISRTY